jgi:tRNA (cytidine/uridine-2'-O-)-methyltransferase
MRLALYEPDIPQNTGTILRLAACLNLGVDLIEPLGFQFDDKRLKRAGLDYVKALDVRRHRSFQGFLDARRGHARPARIVLLTAHAETRHIEFSFKPEDTLLLGRESAGAPPTVHAAADARVGIPLAPGMRSLNVALAAAMVAGEALRQTGGFPAAPPGGPAGDGAAIPSDDADRSQSGARVKPERSQSEEGQSP